MIALASFLDWGVGGLTLADLFRLIGLICIGVMAGWLVSFFLRKIASKIDDKDSYKHIVIDALGRPVFALLISISVYVGLSVITVPSWGTQLFFALFVLIKGFTVWVVIWILLRIVDGVFKRLKALSVADTETDHKLNDMLLPIIRSIIRSALIIIGILMVIQNLGYSISSLIAGLGIGGAAIALASKDTIANVFGSIVVFLDKPFEVDDWIVVNGVEGLVEEIRLRTTLIRTWDNTVVTLPNQLLTTAAVNNYQRMRMRRMNCNFGVYYSTTPDQIRKIVADIQDHIVQNEDIFSDRCWVGFEAFGASSLDISVTAYSLVTSKAEHMRVKQDFMLKIMEIVLDAGSGFAFPTRTIEFSNPLTVSGQRKNVDGAPEDEFEDQKR